MRTAVIVTTYNRPGALALVLEGLLAQRASEFEVHLADNQRRLDTALASDRITAELGLDRYR